MRYRLTAPAYINDRVWPEGSEIGDGTECLLDEGFPAGPHMEPMDGAAKKARAAYDQSNPNATTDPWRLPVVSAYESVAPRMTEMGA